MRIIRQADSAFRYYNPADRDDSNDLMSEDEWFEKARLGPHHEKYTIDNHEDARDAHDLGFVTPHDGWGNRLYKVDDRRIIHEIYPRGHASTETDEQIRNNPRWMMKVSNIPESPDVMMRHHTLADAIEASRNKSWRRPVRPTYKDWPDQVRSLPTGTPFITYPESMLLDPDRRRAAEDRGSMEAVVHGDYLSNKESDVANFHNAWDEGTHDPYSRQDFKRWG